MSQRSDALKAMRGERPERIPFIARMDLWYNYNRARGTLPERYQDWHLWDIQRDLGIGVFAFGAWIPKYFKVSYPGVEVKTQEQGLERVATYETPYGALRTRHVLAEELIDADVTGMQVEHMYKGVQDFDALLYLLENSVVSPNYGDYEEVQAAIGEDGISLPFTGYVPMHEMAHVYMGYETFYYQLFDHPDKIERLHQASWAQQMKAIDLAAGCPAEVIEVGGNYDEQMTPPKIFDQYYAPFYREVAEKFKKMGKILAVHGDGEMKELLTSLKAAGVEVVEAATPAPMTSIDVRAVRELWGDDMTMWGGIASTMFTPTYSDEEFHTYIEDLFAAVAPGDRFVLGTGDNVPTDGLWHRIKWLSDYYQAHATYPLAAR
jgi:hypothetical protein